VDNYFVCHSFQPVACGIVGFAKLRQAAIEFILLLDPLSSSSYVVAEIWYGEIPSCKLAGGSTQYCHWSVG